MVLMRKASGSFPTTILGLILLYSLLFYVSLVRLLHFLFEGALCAINILKKEGGSLASQSTWLLMPYTWNALSQYLEVDFGGWLKKPHANIPYDLVSRFFTGQL